MAIISWRVLTSTNIQTILKNLSLPLGGHRNRVLKEGGTAASRSRPRSNLKGFTLPVPGVTVMDMGIDTAGNYILARRINGALCLWQGAGHTNENKLPVLDAHITLPEATIHIHLTILNY